VESPFIGLPLSRCHLTIDDAMFGLEQDLSVYETHSIKIPLSVPKRRTIDSPYTT